MGMESSNASKSAERDFGRDVGEHLAGAVTGPESSLDEGDMRKILEALAADGPENPAIAEQLRAKGVDPTQFPPAPEHSKEGDANDQEATSEAKPSSDGSVPPRDGNTQARGFVETGTSELPAFENLGEMINYYRANADAAEAAGLDLKALARIGEELSELNSLADDFGSIKEEKKEKVRKRISLVDTAIKTLLPPIIQMDVERFADEVYDRYAFQMHEPPKSYEPGSTQVDRDAVQNFESGVHAGIRKRLEATPGRGLQVEDVRNFNRTAAEDRDSEFSNMGPVSESEQPPSRSRGSGVNRNNRRGSAQEDMNDTLAAAGTTGESKVGGQTDAAEPPPEAPKAPERREDNKTITTHAQLLELVPDVDLEQNPVEFLYALAKAVEGKRIHTYGTEIDGERFGEKLKNVASTLQRALNPDTDTLAVEGLPTILQRFVQLTDEIKGVITRKLEELNKKNKSEPQDQPKDDPATKRQTTTTETPKDDSVDSTPKGASDKRTETGTPEAENVSVIGTLTDVPQDLKAEKGPGADVLVTPEAPVPEALPFVEPDVVRETDHAALSREGARGDRELQFPSKTRPAVSTEAPKVKEKSPRTREASTTPAERTQAAMDQYAEQRAVVSKGLDGYYKPIVEEYLTRSDSKFLSFLLHNPNASNRARIAEAGVLLGEAVDGVREASSVRMNEYRKEYGAIEDLQDADKCARLRACLETILEERGAQIQNTVAVARTGENKETPRLVRLAALLHEYMETEGVSAEAAAAIFSKVLGVSEKTVLREPVTVRESKEAKTEPAVPDAAEVVVEPAPVHEKKTEIVSADDAVTSAVEPSDKEVKKDSAPAESSESKPVTDTSGEVFSWVPAGTVAFPGEPAPFVPSAVKVPTMNAADLSYMLEGLTITEPKDIATPAAKVEASTAGSESDGEKAALLKRAEELLVQYRALEAAFNAEQTAIEASGRGLSAKERDERIEAYGRLMDLRNELLDARTAAGITKSLEDEPGAVTAVDPKAPTTAAEPATAGTTPEKPAPATPEAGTEAKEIDAEVLEAFRRGIPGMDTAELAGIPGFPDLSKDQQLFVLHNLKQYIVVEGQAKSVKEYRDDVTEAKQAAAERGGSTPTTRLGRAVQFVQRAPGKINSLAKAAWLGWTRERQLFNREKRQTLDMFDGDVSYADMLSNLTDMVAKGPHVTREGDRFHVSYVHEREFTGDTERELTSEERALMERFDTAAHAFRRLSYVAKTGSEREREQYRDAEKEYRDARRELIAKRAEGGHELEAQKLGNDIDMHVMLGQQLNACPDVEEYIAGLRNGKVALVTTGAMLGSKVGLMAVGGGTRALAGFALAGAGYAAFVAAPVAGAAVGGIRGRITARHELAENEILLRAGEEWNSPEHNALEKVGKESDSEARDTLVEWATDNKVDEHHSGRGGLINNIDADIRVIEDPDIPAEVRRTRVLKLQRRLKYTAQKIKDDQVNFGKISEHAAHRKALMDAVERGQVTLSTHRIAANEVVAELKKHFDAVEAAAEGRERQRAVFKLERAWAELNGAYTENLLAYPETEEGVAGELDERGRLARMLVEARDVVERNDRLVTVAIRNPDTGDVLRTEQRVARARDVNERVEAYMGYRLNEVSKRQREFVNMRTYQGMKRGAIFALIGAGIMDKVADWWHGDDAAPICPPELTDETVDGAGGDLEDQAVGVPRASDTLPTRTGDSTPFSSAGTEALKYVDGVVEKVTDEVREHAPDSLKRFIPEGDVEVVPTSGAELPTMVEMVQTTLGQYEEVSGAVDRLLAQGELADALKASGGLSEEQMAKLAARLIDEWTPNDAGVVEVDIVHALKLAEELRGGAPAAQPAALGTLAEKPAVDLPPSSPIPVREGLVSGKLPPIEDGAGAVRAWAANTDLNHLNDVRLAGARDGVLPTLDNTPTGGEAMQAWLKNAELQRAGSAHLPGAGGTGAPTALQTGSALPPIEDGAGAVKAWAANAELQSAGAARLPGTADDVALPAKSAEVLQHSSAEAQPIPSYKDYMADLTPEKFEQAGERFTFKGVYEHKDGIHESVQSELIQRLQDWYKQPDGSTLSRVDAGKVAHNLQQEMEHFKGDAALAQKFKDMFKVEKNWGDVDENVTYEGSLPKVMVDSFVNRFRPDLVARLHELSVVAAPSTLPPIEDGAGTVRAWSENMDLNHVNDVRLAEARGDVLPTLDNTPTGGEAMQAWLKNAELQRAGDAHLPPSMDSAAESASTGVPEAVSSVEGVGAPISPLPEQAAPPAPYHWSESVPETTTSEVQPPSAPAPEVSGAGKGNPLEQAAEARSGQGARVVETASGREVRVPYGYQGTLADALRTHLFPQKGAWPLGLQEAYGTLTEAQRGHVCEALATVIPNDPRMSVFDSTHGTQLAINENILRATIESVQQGSAEVSTGGLEQTVADLRAELAAAEQRLAALEGRIAAPQGEVEPAPAVEVATEATVQTGIERVRFDLFTPEQVSESLQNLQSATQEIEKYTEITWDHHPRVPKEMREQLQQVLNKLDVFGSLDDPQKAGFANTWKTLGYMDVKQVYDAEPGQTLELLGDGNKLFKVKLNGGAERFVNSMLTELEEQYGEAAKRIIADSRAQEGEARLHDVLAKILRAIKE